MTRSYWTAPALTVAGGLVLIVATGAPWIVEQQVREVGVALTEQVSTAGTAFAPSAVVAGLALLAGGALLGVVRGSVRRALGGACAAAALMGALLVFEGVLMAGSQSASVTAAPWAALAGAAAALAGSGSAIARPAAPAVRSRYRTSTEQPSDDEWDLAADDEA